MQQPDSQTPARKYAKGMGKAVADRTVNRRIFNEFKKKTWIKTWVPNDSVDESVKSWARNNDYEIEKYVVTSTSLASNLVAEVKVLVKGKYETEEWEDVAKRVALGNSLLIKSKRKQSHEDYTNIFVKERDKLEHHLRQASVILSGRHLQHGDGSQPERNMEVMTNCATAATSFMSFLLLMNGSGVGRCYSDSMMLVDWSYMPLIVTVIDKSHSDVQSGEIVTPDYHNAKHIYSHCHQHYFKVPDTREGWAKAIEHIEVMAYQKKFSNDVLILDFSDVRCKGSPIKGMQNRPASGPSPLINSINDVAKIKHAKMKPWKQTMYIDHFMAQTVLVGGARRAARLAAKVWTDPDILEYISIKKGGFLWSANNSVLVDEEFWKGVRGDWKPNYLTKEQLNRIDKNQAQIIFDAITEAAYKDGTGEPGVINQDKLTHNNEGLEIYKSNGEFISSKKYKLDAETKQLAKQLSIKTLEHKHNGITNPCVSADTWVMTDVGPKQVGDLIDKPFTAIINGKKYKSHTGFWETGNKYLYRVVTEKGYELKVTEDHKILTVINKKKLKNGHTVMEYDKLPLNQLSLGDEISLNNLRGTNWKSCSWTKDTGWLLGLVIGDGCFNPDSYTTMIYLYGEKKKLLSKVESALREGTHCSDDQKYTIREDKEADRYVITSSYLDWLGELFLEKETKKIRKEIYTASSDFYIGLLQGYFDTDGSVQGSHEKGKSIRLSSTSLENLKTVQNMLLRLGIISSLYEGRREAGFRMMPNGLGEMTSYFCQANHELIISKDNINVFADRIGFRHEYHTDRLNNILADSKRLPYREYFVDEIKSITQMTFSQPVYDCNVEEIHLFDANGILVSNCGEITINMLGGYCVLGDVVPYHAKNQADAEDAFRVTTRALIRTNTMDCLYRPEVDRTNRIGVSLTGLHEFAWKFFKYGWKDLINEEKSKDFWLTLSQFKRAIVDECEQYAKELGVTIPHTNTTIKPSGTVSKMFGLTEGAHLPAMREYIRWVQFRNDDPLVKQYESLGYPVKKLQVYAGTTIVGFPTRPEICKLGMGDKLVIASEATMEEQYTWLQLLEKYWIRGVAEDGVTPLPETGNQISYTLKYNPENVSYEQFQNMVRKYQPLVRCCSVMPQTDDTAYEYTPESACTKHEYEQIMQAIKDDEMKEDVDFVHVDCSSGFCPVDFNKPQNTQPQLQVQLQVTV